MASRAEKRNVVIVGKTGAGKSTVGNRILGDGRFEVDSTPSSVTSFATASSNTFTKDGVEYSVTVIDTIGLYDNSGKLSNEQIMDNTRKTIKENVDGLHLVIFVIKNGRFTQEERTTFDTIHKKFSTNIDPISALVITGCEGVNKEKVIQQYKENHVTKQIVAHMQKGIYAVGFPDTNELEGPFQDIFTKSAEEDKATLQELVVRCDTMYLKAELYDEEFWKLVFGILFLNGYCTIL